MKYVILLSGKMRSGKNQIAEYFTEIFEKADKKVEQDYFAKDLKNNCRDDFKVLTDALNSYADGLKSIVNNFHDIMVRSNNLETINDAIDKVKVRDENFLEDKTFVTRALLQCYGTNIFRDRVDSNYWVNRVRDRVIKSDADIILITDVRFHNEVEVFGKIDDDNIKVVSIRMERDTGIVNDHPSETSLDDYLTWNYVVDNNGSLDDLKDSAINIFEDLFKKSLT